MAINTKKVLLGGLAAGVVLNVIDFIAYAHLLKDRMNSEMNAFKPGLADVMMQGNAVIINIILDFILGITLVWTYAAIRPRFGPGARTAVNAALLFWVLSGIFYYGFLGMGIMSTGLWWTFAFVGLVNLLIASWVGAWLYSEEPGAV